MYMMTVSFFKVMMHGGENINRGNYQSKPINMYSRF